MKMKFDKLKATAKNTLDLSKKAANNTKDGISSLIEKSKADGYARRMKKYNPLFPDEYQSESFDIPNIIWIRDDAERRNIDVCEGAIGWLTKEYGAEVLCLYDTAVEFSGIQFVPNAPCDALFYVDNFDHNRFIWTDYIFKQAHEEKIAELENIAFCLGAKRCKIEFSETVSNSKEASKSINLCEASANETIEQHRLQTQSSRSSGRNFTEFKGHNEPRRPELKWFAHDDTIKNLIEMCCNGTREIEHRTLELSGASSATMSQSTAGTIDSTVKKMGAVSGGFSMSSQASKEYSSILLFHIEF